MPQPVALKLVMSSFEETENVAVLLAATVTKAAAPIIIFVPHCDE